MKSSKSILTIFFILFITTIGVSQTDSKDVSITSSGRGKTQEEAKQAALRSATEQAFGAFISSKTEMFNDQVVADQMASVSSGNIKSFSLLNESQLPDGSWGVTIKVLVSIDKLTSFVESKGNSIDIKGGMFALNIKQQLLNEQGEFKAVCEMVGLLHEPMQISFDYTINSSNPVSLDNESKNWGIPLLVKANTNKNIDFCANYCIKTLSAISLTPDELASYQSLKKDVFPVIINYNGVTSTFYLRKEISINALQSFTNQWRFYLRLFTVQSGLDESNGKGKGDIHEFSYEFERDNVKKIVINFLKAGQQAATYSWQDIRTLSQIEQITGYNVKPRGVISQFKHGGFVVYEAPAGYRVGFQMKKLNSNEVLITTPGGIAEKSGIIPGDKIISINDILVENGNIFELLNRSEKTNNLCQFKIDRSGNIVMLNIYPTWVESFGLVAAIFDIGKLDWNAAKTACDELSLNGYSDWHLPSKDELYALYVNLGQFGIGGISDNYYWSSTENNINNTFGQRLTNAFAQRFIDGEVSEWGYDINKEFNVRAVRNF
jgi:hypothetical protein